MDAFGPLVSATWLATHRADPNLRIVDFRFYLDGRSARAAYEAGHIAGAVFVDLDGEVTGHQPHAGRHPLPEREAFERAMRTAGVSRDSAVVVYDDLAGSSACRLWWLLRYFGHERTAVLDGGLEAWPGPLDTGAREPAPGDFVAAAPRVEMKVDYDTVRQLPPGILLLDARAPERFRGEKEPIDPVAGHIPGARSAFFQDNLGEDRRFLSAGELRRRYEALGATEGGRVVAYCGSGVTACHVLLSLEVAGIQGARLYPGSWSEWCSRPGSPVATGGEESAVP
jgi:thiosulfate/3-mercaptopyruvate sulfurtransferase